MRGKAEWGGGGREAGSRSEAGEADFVGWVSEIEEEEQEGAEAVSRDLAPRHGSQVEAVCEGGDFGDETMWQRMT